MQTIKNMNELANISRVDHFYLLGKYGLLTEINKSSRVKPKFLIKKIKK